MSYFLMASSLLDGLLPLGEPIIAGAVTLIGIVFSYVIGRKRSRQEVENLQAEKNGIEAASGVSTAQAAQIISQAAAETVRPLLERMKELQEENNRLDDELLDREAQIRDYKYQLEDLRTHTAKLAVQNRLMKEKFKLQGDFIPELPNE